MNYINKVLQGHNPSMEELINCFEEVRKNGDVVVMKFDGERASDQYTIFITFSQKKKDMIRFDGDNLQSTILSVLGEYVK
jgi:hypothetical protein